MADIYVKLDDLEEVVTQLEEIITEFENATSLSEELESAIGDPFGDSDLRDKARNFEERWDDKRNQLKDGLSGVKDHAKGVIEGIRDWDSQTATQLSNV
ncbi:flagellar protein FlgN [Nocardioides piscis]|uniref:Flagellar protein FlgN n=1 Tax=Nocardioides piscis TaxID=2714938 RepID=A0A6G7YIM2_9ACTN|nr:flagellar protein FlgN [Nocardioides piscis]QIK76591.1 flagellar protein FlgN [Nocardioides piscis]